MKTLLIIVTMLALCMAVLAEQPGAFRLGNLRFDSQEAFVRSGRRCGTALPSNLDRTKIQQDLSAFRKANAVYRQSVGIIEIPVHVHVISSGNEGSIADANIDEQIKVLNDIYNPFGFHFTKAGVDRTVNATWYTMGPGSAAERDAKKTLRIDTSSSLNLYFASPGGGILGWATFPYQLAGDPDRDGVVILNTTLPSGTAGPYDEGKTTVHEVGHWLGLYHTFQGGCVDPGDEVDDTPAEASANYGTPPDTTDTCPDKPGKDPIHNYMDYADDAWMRKFTLGQVDRMKDQVGTYRPQLVPAAAQKTMHKVNTELLGAE